MSVRIVWLDDNLDNEKNAKNLALSIESLEVDFLTPKKFISFLENVVMKSEKPVDLYLIDDRLFKKEKNEALKGRTRGLSYAASVREKFPEVPVYLYSAAKDVSGIFFGLAEAAFSLTDSIIDLKDVLRKGKNLYYDALDYRAIRSAKREDLDTLFELMKVPEADFDKIKLILPSSLKRGLSLIGKSTENPTGNAIAFAKWVRQRLLVLSGLLYDSLFSATKLGMTEKSFLSRAETFETGLYRGIFYRTLPYDLWWSSELDNILYDLAEEKLKDSSSTDLREISKKCFKLRNKEISKCEVCNGIYPETVALNKYDLKERKPVHYSCSIPHPQKTRVLYFDEIREFDPKKV